MKIKYVVERFDSERFLIWSISRRMQTYFLVIICFYPMYLWMDYNAHDSRLFYIASREVTQKKKHFLKGLCNEHFIFWKNFSM